MEHTQIKRLGVFLGPYRNLTTLSAATLSLHPGCQVLNHGSERLLSDSSLNFFERPDRATMDRFITAAVEASSGGRRGQFGGSITHSHAYDDERLKALYAKRFSDNLLKTNASCLVWKDSMRVQQRLMREPELFDQLCGEFSELRFILPIRNPADCAVSSLRTGHVRFLCEMEKPTLWAAIEGVLNALAWGLAKWEARPDRVFVYTQWGEASQTFEALADYLGLAQTEHWRQDAGEAFQPRSGYTYDPPVREFLHQATNNILSRWPVVRDTIMANC